RDRALALRGGDVVRDRAPAPPVRVVVRGAPARVRRDRARVVPPDPDRQRARARQGRGRLLAGAVRRDARDHRRLPGRRADLERVPLPAARRRGGGGGNRRRVHPDGRPEPRSTEGPAGPVLPVALPQPLVDGPSLLALGGARPATTSSSIARCAKTSSSCATSSTNSVSTCTTSPVTMQRRAASISSLPGTCSSSSPISPSATCTSAGRPA